MHNIGNKVAFVSILKIRCYNTRLHCTSRTITCVRSHRRDSRETIFANEYRNYKNNCSPRIWKYTTLDVRVISMYDLFEIYHQTTNVWAVSMPGYSWSSFVSGRADISWRRVIIYIFRRFAWNTTIITDTVRKWYKCRRMGICNVQIELGLTTVQVTHW